MLDTIIRNGEIVTRSGRTQADIGIKDGSVKGIGEENFVDESKQTIDAAGKIVMPGAIDAHTHVESPEWGYKEGGKTGGKSAAAGGVTTFINFIIAESGEEIAEYEAFRDGLDKHSLVDFSFHFAVFSHEQISKVPEFADEGITSFKIFLPYKGEEAFGDMVGVDDHIVYKLMETVTELDVPSWVVVHPENVEPSFEIKQQLREKGEVEGAMTWAKVRPPFLEVDAINRIMLFAEETDCPTHFVHMSSDQGLKAFRENQPDTTVPVTCEAQVQHLTEDARDHGMIAKMNPPFRPAEQHETLWDGVRDGSIKFLSSDHAPNGPEHKPNIWDARPGIPNLQTWFPVALTEVIDNDLMSLPKFVEATSYNPANHYHLTPRKGGIWPGADADIIIIDPDNRTEVRSEELYHPVDYTPYEGEEVIFPELTMSRGEVLYEDGEFVASEEHGEFLSRPLH